MLSSNVQMFTAEENGREVSLKDVGECFGVSPSAALRINAKLEYAGTDPKWNVKYYK